MSAREQTAGSAHLPGRRVCHHRNFGGMFRIGVQFRGGWLLSTTLAFEFVPGGCGSPETLVFQTTSPAQNQQLTEKGWELTEPYSLPEVQWR